MSGPINGQWRVASALPILRLRVCPRPKDWLRIARLPEVPTICIVEDDESVREATKDLIRWLGYSVATFANAEEYLRSDRVAETSCLIADIHMPGMSGADLQDRLIFEGCRIPIIFMTAFPNPTVRARVLQAGSLRLLDQAVQRRQSD